MRIIPDVRQVFFYIKPEACSLETAQQRIQKAGYASLVDQGGWLQLINARGRTRTSVDEIRRAFMRGGLGAVRKLEPILARVLAEGRPPHKETPYRTPPCE